MDPETGRQLREWAEEYNDPKYFKEDPIAFPTLFAKAYSAGAGIKDGAPPCTLQDVETAAVFAAHLAWGRRAMIVRDCSRLFDEMLWRPYDYVMAGDWRNDATSLHRTVKWSEIAAICRRLRDFYGATSDAALAELSAEEMRVKIYGQKADPRAANKKIWMLRRWMVRDDGRVDLGVWKHSSRQDLVIPLDVHVYRQATELGLTTRRSKDFATALDITAAFREIFPDDPAKGDFALFGYGVTRNA